MGTIPIGSLWFLCEVPNIRGGKTPPQDQHLLQTVRFAKAVHHVGLGFLGGFPAT